MHDTSASPRTLWYVKPVWATYSAVHTSNMSEQHVECYKTNTRGDRIIGEVKVEVKMSHTRCRALGPKLIPVYGQSAHRWL